MRKRKTKMNIIQKGFEEFEEKFGVYENGILQEKMFIPPTASLNDIKSHLRQMFLSLANERIGSLRGRVRQKGTGVMCEICGATTWCKCDAINEALSEEITYWQNFINQLNEIR